MLLILCAIPAFLCIFNVRSVNTEGLIEVFKWKQMDYERPGGLSSGSVGNKNGKVGTSDFVFPSYGHDSHKPDHSYNSNNNDIINSTGNSFDYIPYNNVPMGATHHKGRLFITMPRRRPGIPATLNYIDLRTVSGNSSPKLKGYPSYSLNTLHPRLEADSERIVSVYRTKVDACNRLWFIDTGVLEYPDNRNQVQQPSIWVINLENDQIIRRFEIPAEIVSDGRGLASITVDVDKNSCNDAYAYIPDLLLYSLYTYRFQDNHMWTFHHNYFSFDPLAGDLSVGGQNFQWNDGIFSITLGNRQLDGFKTAYFHPMCSNSEFSVSTRVLKNETSAARSYHHNDFQHLGSRGHGKQSTMHDFDLNTGIIFYAEISKYAVGCWNTIKPFSDKNHAIVQSNERTMIYPSDLTIDEDGFIWVMTNSMPIFIYSNLNPNEVNFRVWKQSVFKAIENTRCSFN